MIEAITQCAPRGKRCTECLCCDAVIVVEIEGKKVYLCAACDDGTHPPLFPAGPSQTKCITAPLTAGIREVMPLLAAGAAMNAMLDNLPISPKEETQMTIKSGRHGGQRIDQKTIEAILAEPASESHAAVARKYGVTDVTVGLYRRKAGIKSAAKPGPKAPAKQPKPRAADPWIPDPPPTMPKAAPVKPCRSFPVTINITEEQLDAWWRSLGIDVKANFFTGNYTIRVEGFVS